jgi:hypothetical protein
MTLIHFGTSAFESLECSKSLSPLEVLYTHSYRLSATRPFAIDDCDPLRDFDVQEFQTFQHLFPPVYSIPRVTDRAPHVPSRSMVVIHFGTSTFGSFKHSYAFFSSEVLCTQIYRSSATHPFVIKGYGPLQDIGLWEFNLSTLALSRSAFNRSRRSIDACLP